MNNINKQDVSAYVLSLGLSDIDSKGCIDTFMAIHTLTGKAFQDYIKNEVEAKEWYAEMYGYIYQYKKEKEEKKLNDLLPGFDVDIRSYTDNKRCIEHFSNGFKRVWLSLTEKEKKEIVEKFRGQSPNDDMVPAKNKIKKSSDVAVDSFFDKYNSTEAMKDFEEVPTYDDNETIIEYTKKENKDAVILNEFDIDSLFVD